MASRLCARQFIHSGGFQAAGRVNSRTFFASSTDHTRLLAESKVHKIPQKDDPNVTMYVMAADGVDSATVEKVPQLHLARIFLDTTNLTMYGAKVVNRTLGDPETVCPKLVDAVLQDNPAANVKAKSSLHGLSDWVLQGLGKDSLQELVADKETFAAVEAIARGSNIDDSVFERGSEAWEQLARKFIEQRKGKEASLYQSKGGELIEIQHRADSSEYANTAGFAMALFKF